MNGPADEKVDNDDENEDDNDEEESLLIVWLPSKSAANAARTRFRLLARL